MSESSYAVGNRVYRGGSNAPTRGTVDPTGYVERERLKKAYQPANGQTSERRSGLAEKALNPSGTKQRPSGSRTSNKSQMPAPLAPPPQVNELGSIIPPTMMTPSPVEKPVVSFQDAALRRLTRGING